MEPLTFQEIAKLINRTRAAELEAEPAAESSGNWEFYKGNYRVHTNRYPFSVLYLQSRTTVAALREAKRQVFKAGETHVVFAPSLDERQSEHRSLFKKDAAGKFWNTKEFLASFIYDELSVYLGKLKKLSPRYYVEPRIETPSGLARKRPNPITSLLLDPDTSKSFAEGALGVLLAVPGQGKTYMSEYLVSELAQDKSKVFPIYVNADQWGSMTIDDLSSPWKTIVHSFEYFEAPISWLNGCEQEFLRTTLKAGVFRIVFDGFDEYILKNKGRASALDTLKALSGLAESTGSRIVVTSRSAFWDGEIDRAALEAELGDRPVYLYEIKPFDSQEAGNYFKKRFESDSGAAQKATDLYNELKKRGAEFVGRGFVLSLVADLIGREPEIKIKDAARNPVIWLMEALCERDRLRQGLPINAEQQLNVLQLFVSEIYQGERPESETLDLAIATYAPSLDEATRIKCMEGMSSHALINRKPGGRWDIEQEQVEVALLAMYLIKRIRVGDVNSINELKAFSSRADLPPGVSVDVASMMVEMVMAEHSDADWHTEFKKLVAGLINVPASGGPVSNKSALKNLSMSIALKAVDKTLGPGSTHKERTEYLLSLFPKKEVLQLSISGSISRMDFSGVKFTGCRFDHVKWFNCKFDKNTLFDECHFVGGGIDRCNGFGVAEFKNLTTDDEAHAFISAEQIQAGVKAYGQDDLKADLHSVLDKFIGKGGLGFKTVASAHLSSGTIGKSRYKDKIIEELKKRILEEHPISGSSEHGYNIRESEKEAVRFYAANNVFSGALQEVYDHLTEKIGI